MTCLLASNFAAAMSAGWNNRGSISHIQWGDHSRSWGRHPRHGHSVDAEYSNTAYEDIDTADHWNRNWCREGWSEVAKVSAWTDCPGPFSARSMSSRKIGY